MAAAHALSIAVHWPHRIEDWRFVLGLGEGVVAEGAGRVVGTAMAWRFGPCWASTGMVIVAPEYQGRGLGRRLMDEILRSLSDRNVALHATEAGAPLYRTLGFTRNEFVLQQQGFAASADNVAPQAGAVLRPAAAEDTAALVALDAEATGMPRAEAIAALRQVSDAVVLDRGGEVQGFALIREFGRGRVIGPVVAPCPDAARVLVSHWLTHHPGQFLRIDVPEASGLAGWLATQGLAQAGQALHMVRGATPSMGTVRSFALANQALG